MAQVKKQGSPKKKSAAGKNKSIPAKKPEAPKQSKGLFGLSRAQTVLLIWVLIIGSLLFIGYKYIVVPEQQKNDSIAAEQQRFTEGQRLIDDLATKAAQGFPPTEKKAENSCSYVSMKYGNGPLSCTIKQSLIYRDVSVDEANRLMLGINNITGNKPLSNGYNQAESNAKFLGLDDGRTDQYTSSEVDTLDFCRTSYYYPAAKDPYSTIKFGDKDLLVTFWCSQAASKEFYPTTNKNY